MEENECNKMIKVAHQFAAAKKSKKRRRTEAECIWKYSKFRAPARRGSSQQQ